MSKPKTAAETAPYEDDHGFLVRRDPAGNVVLHGKQTAEASFSLGVPGATPEKETVTFIDGTPVVEVVEAMNEVADSLLLNSSVESGWYVVETAEEDDDASGE